MKTLHTILLTSVCLLMAGATVPLQAASFDCLKAQTDDEITICNKQHLSDLDTEMATLYGVQMKIPMMMGARGALKDAQSEFLKKRRSCGDDGACIQKLYQSHIKEMNEFIDTHMDDYCKLMGLCG